MVYENLPNIPFYQDDDLQNKQTSSSYIGNRVEKVPEFVHSNLLNLHYLAILQAKELLTEKGLVLSSIGGRIPLSNILNMTKEVGLEGNFLTLTWKIQSEPEEIIGGYAAWQKQGLGPFHFYPVEILKETFLNMNMVAAGDQALEIEHALLPYHLVAVSAYEAHLQGNKLGHTVAVLMSGLKGE